MVSELRFQVRRVSAFVFVLICMLSFVSVVVNAAESGQANGPKAARYRVFSLRHISAETGKQYLADVGTGTATALPGTETLLVTASQEDLVKASAVLRLVDSEERYVVKQVMRVSEPGDVPSFGALAEAAGDISIGTFFDPPGDAGAKAIVDVHNETLFVIAPSEQVARITSAIEALQKARSAAKEGQMSELLESVEPNRAVERASEKAAEAQVDELFNSLLGSLAEAERKATEQSMRGEDVEEVRGAPEASGREEPAGPADVQRQAPGAAEMTVAEPNATDAQAEAVELEPEEGADESAGGIVKRSYEPEPVLNGDEALTLDLPEKLGIIDLLDLVGKHLNLNYMYDDKQLAGKEVALRVQGPVKVSELYPLLESVMKFRGFVMTRRGDLVTVVPAEEALRVDPALLGDEHGLVEAGDVVVTRIFNLKHVDTASAQTLLSEMKLGANIRPIAATGTLIVTDYAHRMGRIEDVLEMIDKPGEPKEFRFRQLKYTMAATLAPKVKSLVEQLGEISITIAKGAAQPPSRTAARRTPARRTPTPARQPTPAAKPSKPTVYLDADERTNRILMIGLESELDIVEELVDALDVEQQDLRSLRLYEIQNVDAEEVRSKLQELGMIGAARTTTGRGRAQTGRITQPRAGQAQAPAARSAAAVSTTAGTAEPLAEEPQVVVIEATNSLLVNATSEQHMQIAVIIGYVDAETLEQAIPYVIYPLENQKPEDLAEILNKLIEETIRDPEGKVERVVSRQEEDIVIVPDESTFSLIVYASRKNQEWISNLIKTLDKRRPQVLIDVSLVEITRDDKFQYDLNIIANAKDLVTGNIGVLGVLPIATSSSELEGGWNVGGAQNIKGFYAEDRIQALLTAMASKGYGRVLARPKILVNDNEEGVINTTEKTYVGEKTTSYPSGGTTGGVGFNPIEVLTYKPYEAKIELTITPNISEGDLLRLEINMIREDFEKQAQGPPDYRTSNVTTTVTVPDGSTIILGGLTKLKQTKAGSKVPLLGDIPLVGGLFRTIDNSDKASKLYIFVKANILRPDETVGLAQLEKISTESKVAFEAEERRFQSKEGWPGIEPEPIDPVHVLEAE